MAEYTFNDLIECIFLVVANASNTLPPHLDRPFTESALEVVLDKLWSGDATDKETILSTYEKWMGYRYEEFDDDGDSESIGSE
jgi:hypothetical protein